MKKEFKHSPCLSKTMCPGCSLKIILRVEVRIKEDNSVCSNKIEPLTTYISILERRAFSLLG